LWRVHNITKRRDTIPVTCKKIIKGKLQEVELLTKLNHPNVVRVFGIFEDMIEAYLVLENLSKGPLDDFLKSDIQSKLSLNDLLTIAIGVCSGMVYLEQQNIHRDLCARSVWVEYISLMLPKLILNKITESDGKYIAKVTDFSSSRELRNGIYVSSNSQYSIKRSPPEVLRSAEFTFKSDVWSFGILLWEILEFGKVPYEGMSDKETTEKVAQGYRLPCPSQCSAELYDEVMLKCWNIDPNHRLTFKSILSILVRQL